MSYGRIGRRNLERFLVRQAADEQIKTMVGYGEKAPSHALKIHLNPEDEKDFPNAWLDPNAVADQVGKFYALYREPESFSVGRVLCDRAETFENEILKGDE